MTNFKIKNDLFFTLEKSEGNTDFPRTFFATKISGNQLKISTVERTNQLVGIWELEDFTIDGVTYTDVFLAINALQPILWNGSVGSSSTPPSIFITSVTTMQTPTGEIVYFQTFSDGTTKYVNPDGTDYTGVTADLLPYPSNPKNEKELIIPISQFTESGSFDYFLPSSEIGIEIINSVEIGEDIYTLNAISNYTISPSGDLTINSNVQLTSEIVRITGQK